MQKDQWNIARRNFRALAIISILPTIFFILGFMDTSNSEAVRMVLLRATVLFIILCIVYFIIAHLFKKRSPKAIPVAYTVLTLSAVSSLANSFIFNSPSDFFTKGLIMNILPYLILIYLFMNVRNASKQTPISKSV